MPVFKKDRTLKNPKAKTMGSSPRAVKSGVKGKPAKKVKTK